MSDKLKITSSISKFIPVGIMLILMLFLMVISGPVLAQDNQPIEPDSGGTEGLTMEVRAPLGTFIRQGCYCTVKVTIENTGRSRSGQIRIVSQDLTHPLTASFIAECDIPSNSRKTYYLYPYLLNHDPSPVITIEYVERNTRLASQAIELDLLLDEEKLWVEVADEGSDFVFLSGTSLPEYSSFSDLSAFHAEEQAANPYSGRHGRTPYNTGSGSDNVRYVPAEPKMAWCRPEHLPDRPEGYQAVDGLILNTRRFYELSQDQKSALSDWMISGGAMIVWMGDDPNRYQGSFLTGWVDGSGVDGPYVVTEPLVRDTLTSLKTVPGFSGRSEVHGNFPVTYATQESARTLFAEDDIPVLQHLRLGHGDILLSGLDLAALKSTAPTGLSEYLTFMIGHLMSVDDRTKPIIKAETPNLLAWRHKRQTAVNPFIKRSLYRSFYDINNTLLSDQLTALPTTSSIALFLLVYIILVGPLNYYVLLKMRRREWLWYTIPVVVTTFILFSYTWALGTKGSRLMLTRVNIVDAYPEQQVAWETSFFSLFSPVAKRYDIQLETSHDLIRRLETPIIDRSMYGVPEQPTSPGDMVSLVHHGKKGDSFIDDAYIRIWSEMHFESQGAIYSPGFAGLEDVSINSGNLTGKLKLSLNYDIDGLFLFYSTQGEFTSRPLVMDEDIDLRDATIDFSLPLDMRGALYASTPGGTPGGKASQLRDAAIEMINLRPMQNSGEEELILAGWISEPGERSLSSPHVRSITEETLVLMHIPIRVDTGRSLIEGARGQIVGIKAVNMEIENTGNLLLTDGQMLYSICFPQFSPTVEQPKSLRINVGTDENNSQFDVSIFNHQISSWQRMTKFGSTKHRTMIKLNDLDRYLSPDGRTILMKIDSNPDIPGDVISLNGITVNAS